MKYLSEGANFSSFFLPNDTKFWIQRLNKEKIF